METLLALQDVLGLLLLLDHGLVQGFAALAVGEELPHLFEAFLDLVLEGFCVLGLLELAETGVHLGVDLNRGGGTYEILCYTDMNG